MGRYIVVFHDWVEDPETIAREQIERYGGNLGFVYKHALKGYSAGYLPSAAEALQAEPTVDYVEVDQLIWMDESSGVAQWYSCPGAPPLGPAPPVNPEDPEVSGGPDTPEEAGVGVQQWHPEPVALSDVESPAIRCHKAKERKGKRCIARGNRKARICKQRTVAARLRC